MSDILHVSRKGVKHWLHMQDTNLRIELLKQYGPTVLYCVRAGGKIDIKIEITIFFKNRIKIETLKGRIVTTTAAQKTYYYEKFT